MYGLILFCLCFAALIPLSSQSTIKRTEQPCFLQAEENWKNKCSDAGVRYYGFDPGEDKETTERRRNKMRQSIERRQEDVRTNNLFCLCFAHLFFVWLCPPGPRIYCWLWPEVFLRIPNLSCYFNYCFIKIDVIYFYNFIHIMP